MLFLRSLVVVALGALSLAQTAPQNSAPSQQPAASGQAQTAAPATPPTPQTKPGADARQNSTNPEADRERSGADPLLDLPALPNRSESLVGGTVARLDRIRDRMALRPFGGGNMNIAFDIRTKIYRDGEPGTVHDIKPGSRVYVDTMLNGDQVFARSIRVQTHGNQGDAHGQVVAYDSEHQVLTLREQVAPQPVKLRVNQQTLVQVNGKPGSVSDIKPGALVAIRFESGADSRDVAREIRVLASPGTSFTFAGTVTFLDLRNRRMAIDNRTDNENYEILMESVPTAMLRDLRVGSDATVKAVFDGQNYQARSIDVAPRASKTDTQQ
jgi:hypothetical protein